MSTPVFLLHGKPVQCATVDVDLLELQKRKEESYNQAHRGRQGWQGQPHSQTQAQAPTPTQGPRAAPRQLAQQAYYHGDAKAGEENVGLISEKGKNAGGATVAEMCCYCNAMAMGLSVLCLVVISLLLYVRVDGVFNDASLVLQPHARSILSDITRIANNTAKATGSLVSMGVQSDRLVSVSTPMLTSMMNHTNSMVANMHSFTSQSPTISIGPTGAKIG